MAGELEELSYRGLTLLSRGTPDARLKGLRKRMLTLLLTYLQMVRIVAAVMILLLLVF